MTELTRRRFLSLGGSLIGASAIAGCAGQSSPQLPVIADSQVEATITAEERRRRRFVNNPLVNHEGKTVHFYDDLLKGKTVMINFMYVFCKNEGFCPVMSQNLSKVQAMLGDRIGKEVFMYSITLDPETDTPELLAAYAKHFKPKPGGWQFLTGTKENVSVIRESLGFRWTNQEQDKQKQEHIGILKYGIEPLERWGMCPVLSKPEAIVAYLDWMKPNGKRPFG
jgi:protein SCO1